MAIRTIRRSKRNSLFFYDVLFTTIPLGIAFDLNNPANSGKIIILQKINLRGGTSFIINLQRQSSPNTGGTSTGLSGANAYSDGEIAVGTSKIYTVAPTPGTLEEYIIRAALSTTMLELNFQNGNGQDEGIAILPGETLSLVSNISTSLQGYFQTREIEL